MKNNSQLLFYLFVLIGFGWSMHAQDLLKKLEQEYPDTSQYETATFKTNRIAIGHSVKNRKKGVLDLVTMSRFWNSPEGGGQSFVADKLNTRIALEYGITDRMTFGVGGATMDGVFDGFLKYKAVRQGAGSKGSPVSINVFQNGSYRSKRLNDAIAFNDFSDKLAFTSQVLIARKWTRHFSLQLSPTLIHRESAMSDQDPNTQFALGIGGRYRLGGHVAIVSEYYYVANPLESIDTYNAFALGVNWELSDVMLQFLMTNTKTMVEDTFITQTQNNFNTRDGNFVFGFNFTYVLHLNRKHKK